MTAYAICGGEYAGPMQVLSVCMGLLYRVCSNSSFIEVYMLYIAIIHVYVMIYGNKGGFGI